MMATERSQTGLTLIEMMVVLGMLSIVTFGFYQVLYAGTTGSQRVRSITEISEEARLGLNRMIRDTRQARGFISTVQLPAPSATSYSIDVDLDGSSQIENPNSQGDYETETFIFNAVEGEITLTGGRVAPYSGPHLLVTDVQQIPSRAPFSYSSNHLEYDWSTSPGCIEICGVTTYAELVAAPTHGVAAFNPFLYLSNINFALRIGDDSGTAGDFYAQAQLRNLR